MGKKAISVYWKTILAREFGEIIFIFGRRHIAQRFILILVCQPWRQDIIDVQLAMNTFKH